MVDKVENGARGEVETKVTTFRQDVKEMDGGWRSLFGIELVIAFVLTATIAISGYLLRDDVSGLGQIYLAYLTGSVAILSFIIAAFAFVASVGDQRFKDAMKKTGVKNTLSVDFCWTAILMGTVFLISVIGAFLSGFIPDVLSIMLFLACTFFFTWGVMNIVMITTNSLRLLWRLT